MSALVLPPPEGPVPARPSTDTLRVRLRIARDSLAAAGTRRAHVDEWAGEEFDWPSPLVLEVLASARDVELIVWSHEVIALVAALEALGEQP